MQATGFIRDGLDTLKDTLLDAVARTGLHLSPETLSRSFVRHLRAQFRLVETQLRRRLVLMALEMMAGLPEPAPVRKRKTSSKPKLYRWRFRLTAQPRFDAARLEALRERPKPASKAPIPAAPWRHRHGTLTALLRHPERAARTMARRLRKLRASGEPRPFIAPVRRTDRLPSRLALIASALPGQITEKLRDWWGSG